MPEGPSIAILKDEAALFKGKEIIHVGGNTKVDKDQLLHQRVIDFKSWGKHFLICFENFAVRIHLMLYGSYRINDQKESASRLSMQFSNGVLNFYNCSVKIIENDLNEVYDWEVDVMSDEWNPDKALRALKQTKENTQICDVLLDQNIFAGSGNIIKNEVLFRIKVHPESMTDALPAKKIKELIGSVRAYSFDFYKWKKAFELKKHWLVYRQKKCSVCGSSIVLKMTGKNKRRSFFCKTCQVSYQKK